MTRTLRDDLFFVDVDGGTYGLSSDGEFRVDGEVGRWIAVVGEHLPAAGSVDALVAGLDEVRADHIRRVSELMDSRLMWSEQADNSGRVTVKGTCVELRDVCPEGLAVSGHDIVLGGGDLFGSWLDDLLSKGSPDDRVGLLLEIGAETMVISVRSRLVVERMVETLRAHTPRQSTDPAARPLGRTLAVAQLIRSAREEPGDAWDAHVVEGELSSTRRRVGPHPWVASSPPLPSSDDLLERVVPWVDPVYGVLYDVDEADLPQVPLHLCGAEVRDRLGTEGPVRVLGFGPSFEAARYDVVLRALALSASITPDPVTVEGLLTEQSVSRDELLACLRRGELSARVDAVHLATGSPTTVDASLAYRLAPGGWRPRALAAAETRWEAVRAASLDALEEVAVELARMDGATRVDLEALVHDDAGAHQVSLLRAMSDDLDVADVSASLGAPAFAMAIGDIGVLGVGGTRPEAAARVRTAGLLATELPPEQAADLVTLVARSDLAPFKSSSTRRAFNDGVDSVERVLTSHVPHACAVDLDGDPDLQELGVHVVKVVAQG